MAFRSFFRSESRPHWRSGGFSQSQRARRLGLAAAEVTTAALLLAAWKHWLPLNLTEVSGFVTGAWCVWLAAEENIWNWPIGIANSVFFGALFFHACLYADMALQGVYIVLGVLGWYWWLRGGRHRAELPVAHVPTRIVFLLLGVVAICTFAMTLYLRHVHDSAPFWDAVTTTFSLAAQYLLTKKWLENWYIWMAADVIYIPLYFYKHLYLTGSLYLLFLWLCLYGLSLWRRSFTGQKNG